MRPREKSDPPEQASIVGSGRHKNWTSVLQLVPRRSREELSTQLPHGETCRFTPAGGSKGRPRVNRSNGP